jgi:hypothetical protein
MNDSNSPNTLPPINIHELHENHPQIRAADFRSPLVRRLSQANAYQDGEATMMNSYRDLAGGITERLFQLRWAGLAEDFRRYNNTYQEPVITEHATIGLACIFVDTLLGQEITEVTMRGQKADYWIGDREAMLEVSGQQEGDIESLCEQKSVQLLENPLGFNGYVCVSIYNDSQSRFWYYAQDESDSL